MVAQVAFGSTTEPADFLIEFRRVATVIHPLVRMMFLVLSVGVAELAPAAPREMHP